MADLNQQAQELAELMERVNDEMRRFGKISEETADALKAGSDKRAKELKAAGEATVDALSAVARAGTAAAGAMYEGKKGAGAFNESLDEMSKAATAAGVALTFLIPGGPAIKLLVAGITAATGALITYTKAANDMADKLYKGYSGLQKSGAAASDGMTGLFRDAKKLGLSMNELDGFVSLVGENSKDLALFGGSVFEGRKKFADMGKALEGSREKFLRLGITQEEQNKAAMGYLRLQSQIGMSQKLTTDQLAEGARKYLYEQDALTKLTGMAREEQEKAREEIRSQERFGAKLMELRQQGREKEAKELENAYLILRSQNREAAQGFADIATNNVQTEAAQKSLMGTQGESMRVAQQISAGQIDAVEGVQRVAKAHGDTVDALGATMGQIGTYNQTFGDLAGDIRLKMLAEGDLREKFTKILDDQNKSVAGSGDQLVNNQAKLIVTQQQANEALERFVFQGIAPAQAAMIKLAKATNAAGQFLNDLTGKTGLTEEEKAQDEANWKKFTVMEKVESSLGRGIEEAGKGIAWLTGLISDSGEKFVDNIVANAQRSRIEGETDYLKKQGRAHGSLGATGKLIEDFGRGTTMVLHGREGVVTEAQLKEFADTAMKMGQASMVPAGAGRDGMTTPVSVKEATAAFQKLSSNLTKVAGAVGRGELTLQEAYDELQFKDQRKGIEDQLEQQVEIETDNTKDLQAQRDDMLDLQRKMQSLAENQYTAGTRDLERLRKFTADRQSVYNAILANLQKQNEAIDKQTQQVIGSTATPPVPAGGAGGGAGGGAAPSSGPALSTTATYTSAPSGPEPHSEPVGQGGGAAGGKPQLVRVGSKTGKSAMVNAEYASRFQGIIDYLDGIGYNIYSLGGYVDRDVRGQPGKKSVHAHGGAIDINPAENPLGSQLVTDMPAEIGQVAAQLGLGWGGNWRSIKDAMHFSVAKHEGGTVKLSEGGVLTGPQSGYRPNIEMHGTEAVIPLKNGNVPVDIPKMDQLLESNNEVTKQLEKLRTDFTRTLESLTESMKNGSGNEVQREMVELLNLIARNTGTSADANRRLAQVAAN